MIKGRRSVFLLTPLFLPLICFSRVQREIEMHWNEGKTNLQGLLHFSSNLEALLSTFYEIQ